MSGITSLLQTLKELEKRDIKGEILTTNYLNFSEPKALKKLNELSNITLKMYDVEASDEGFHTKGYIFRKDEIYRIIIGSSNITSAALTSNREWNTRLISTEQGEMTKEIIGSGEDRALLISATGAHVILMTGRTTFIYKEFGPVFSIFIKIYG